MKEHERATIEKAERITTELEKSPLLKKLRADEAKKILAKRTAAAAKIEDLKLDFEACHVIQREIDSMISKLAALDNEREKIKGAINEKYYFMIKEKTGIDNGIRQQREILCGCYDPRIDEAIIFFRDKLDDLRKPGKVNSRGMNIERNLFTDRKKITMETNEGAVLGALQYCMAAIQGFESLKLAPEFQTEKIQELKDGIPSIEQYQEVTSETPLPESRGINPLHLLKSDSQLDWEIGKLNERFKKLMRK